MYGNQNRLESQANITATLRNNVFAIGFKELTGISYLGILKLFLTLQLQEDPEVAACSLVCGFRGASASKAICACLLLNQIIIRRSFETQYALPAYYYV
jgi:hypothetical protein